MAAKNRSNELKLTRLYDAPVEAVWDAWTDPEQVAKWWGPRGFTLTTHGKDLRVGGYWRYTMHGPDGTDYENKTVYHEVEKHKKLVYDHGGGDDRPPLFRVTVLFSEEKGKTRMEMTMTLPTPEAAEQTKKFIKQAGGNSTWDRLAEYLEKESTGQESFVINRSFEAPRDLVFRMWADKSNLFRWLPPEGMRMEILDGEIQAGQRIFYRMRGESAEILGRIEYREISRPDRIVYSQQFCDEKENVVRHPMVPTWPASMLTTVSFAEEGNGQTRVTVRWEPEGVATAEEIAAFVRMRGSMTQGWSGSFDKLEEILSGESAE